MSQKKFSKDFPVSEIEICPSPFLAAYRKSYNTHLCGGTRVYFRVRLLCIL